MPGDIFTVTVGWGGGRGLCYPRVGVGDAARHPTMPRTAPTSQDGPVQRISGATDRKPGAKQLTFNSYVAGRLNLREI